MTTAQVLRQMKSEWDARATHGYATRGRTEDEVAALAAVETDQLLLDVVEYLGPESAVLEIGCGNGKFLGPMAERFREVWGVDVSGAMIAKAHERLGHLPSVTLLENNGVDLSGVPSDHFDFCFAAPALECVPEPAVIQNYICEAYRILKPGGIAKLVVGGIYAANPYRAYYEDVRDTWAGRRFTMSEAVRMMEVAGFELWDAYHAERMTRPVPAMRGQAQHRIWLIGGKGRGMEAWEALCWDSGRALQRLVPEGATVMLAEQLMIDHLHVAAPDHVRFIRMDRTSDAASSIRVLEDLRRRGGEFAFWSRHGRWQLDWFPEFRAHLEARYRLVEENPDYVIFDVRGRA